MPKLTDPITIRDMEVKNRLGYPPMLSFSSLPSGEPSEATYMIYEEKARGGIGLLTSEATAIDPHSYSGEGAQAYLGVDENIPAYKIMADKIHKYGTKIGMQLAENGIIHFLGKVLGVQGDIDVFGPSEIDPVHATSAYDVMMPSWAETIKKEGLTIREMTNEEIPHIQDQFAKGAKRAIQAGYDYVEIHSAHGTLHASFLAPYYNKRTDQYGGSLENRTRFGTETIEKIRAAIGEKPPIFVRISADELLDDGFRIEEGKKIAQIFEKAGADCIDVSMGNMIRSPQGIQIPSNFDQGSFIHLAEAVKKVVDIPVIGVGRITDMKMANEFIQQGKADIIYMGRQLICDPDTPNKYFNGQLDDIKHCVGCLQGCNLPPQTCIYDAFSGRLYEEIVHSTELKKVVILGAGVAGMEAARMLKLRGHDVEIYEISNKVGGLIPLLAAEYKKEDFMYIVTYLETQLRKLDVPIHLNKELTKEEIEALNPDILVLAVGSDAAVPVNLEDRPNILTQDEAILKSKPMGKEVVVWGLDTFWKGGAETAITLIEQGYNVKALIGSGVLVAGAVIMGTGRRFWILDYLRTHGIPITKKAKLLDVTQNSVKYLDENKNEQSIEADTLVYCGSRVSRAKALKKQLSGISPKIVTLGDAKRPRDIQEAIKDAQTFVRKLK